MRLIERHFGNAAVLDLAGPLVSPKADGIIEGAVRRQIRAGRRFVIANLADVPSIDAAGLGALIVAYNTLRQDGGALKLACVPRRIHDVIAITRLTAIFEIFDSVERAMKEAKKVDPISNRINAQPQHFCPPVPYNSRVRTANPIPGGRNHADIAHSTAPAAPALAPACLDILGVCPGGASDAHRHRSR